MLPADRADTLPAQPEAVAECVRPDRLWQYKRLVKEQVARLNDGQYDEAIRCLHAFSEEYYPTDPEFMYGLCLGYSLKGDLERATDYAQRAVDAGLPFGRFLAGPRSMLTPLYSYGAFKRLIDRYGTHLIHGPMLGSVTDRSARFWVRTWRPSTVRVRVSEAGGPSSSGVVSAPSHVDPGRDFTAVVAIDALSPDTDYTYQLYVDDIPQNEEYTFRTFPRAGAPARFDIGFGGCAGYTPWHERIWRTIASYQFPLFLLTGDNVYIDDPTRNPVNEYCYYRRQSRPEFRELVAGTSIAAIWDDHDFGTNDCWGGPSLSNPPWKIPVWNTFCNNWNNPGYGGGPQQPGCWFDFSIGDVDLFMLDGRFYRTDHKNPPADRPASMLGDAQKRWLFDRLNASQATFKLLVTSVPWAYGVKPGSTDPWQGFQDEREELFSFIEQHSITGVILLSGDRHRADIWKIERQHGYDLYDFENARLTNLHTHDVLPGAIYGYNAKCTFGRLRFDTTLADPEVIYDIISIDNEIVYSFRLKHSQIRF